MVSTVDIFVLVAALRDAVAVTTYGLLRHVIKHGRLRLRQSARVNSVNYGPLSERCQRRRRLLPLPRWRGDHRLYPGRLPLNDLLSLLLLLVVVVLLWSLRRRSVPRRRSRPRCAALSGLVRGPGGFGPANGPALELIRVRGRA